MPRPASRDLWRHAKNGKDDMVRAAVSDGALFSDTDKRGRNAFHYAIEGGNSSTVKLLLELGAWPAGASRDGKIPLALCAELDEIECAEALLEGSEDAGINHQNKKGWTPLHIAAFYGHQDMISLLAQEDWGAQLHLVDSNGDSPLHIAAKQKHVDVYRLLVENGADDTIRNKEAKTPKEIMEQGHMEEIEEEEEEGEMCEEIEGDSFQALRARSQQRLIKPTMSKEQKEKHRKTKGKELSLMTAGLIGAGAALVLVLVLTLAMYYG